MKIVSFFSGAGGMDLGFSLAGHKIIWSNDFDIDAVNTYNLNVGKYNNHKSVFKDIVKLISGDIDSIDKVLPDCDMIIGGFPCQGFSIANISRSMEDSRNFLYEQLLKAISVKKPDYFILENVKGLENIEGGRVIKMILDDLELAGSVDSKYFPSKDFEGYKVFYNVVNALDFGVPQNRERVIILGTRKNIFDKSYTKNLIKENKKTSRKYDERKVLSFKKDHSSESNIKSPMNPIDLINKLYNGFKIGKILDIGNDEKIYSHNNLKDAIFDLPSDFDEKVLNHIGSECKVTLKNTVGNRPTYWDNHAPTIMGRGSGTGGPLIPPHPESHRRLSVRETARIQTFPDSFNFLGSKSSAYRQIGNAVPVLMAYKIAKNFK
jgi:DNA (cytosine-5)-methyltransferase 1